jgi:hypothetical protein
MKSFQNFTNTIVEAEKVSIKSNINPQILPTPSSTESPSKPTRTKKPTKTSKSGYQYGKEGRVTQKDIDVFQTRQRTGGYGEQGATRGGQPGVGQTKTVATVTQGPYAGATPITRTSRDILRTYAKNPGVGQNPLRSEPGSELTSGQQRIKKKLSKKIAQKYDIGTEPKDSKVGNVVEPSPRTPAAKDAFADMKAETERQTKKAAKRAKSNKINYKSLFKAIKDLPDEPKVSTKLNKSTNPKVVSTTYKSGTANLSNLKSVPAKATKSAASVSRTQSIASTLKDVLKTQRDAKAAQRAAFATGAKKTLGNIGKVAGLVGAGLEAKSGYDTARAQGASKKTAAATGGLKAAGALAGGAIGGALGGVLGVPGAIGGSVAGYTLGTKAGEAAAKALRGDYAKKFTTKDLQTNVRKAVPYSVRSQIPGQVRKGFSDFVTQAGKTYGNWAKSQQKQNNK